MAKEALTDLDRINDCINAQCEANPFDPFGQTRGYNGIVALRTLHERIGAAPIKAYTRNHKTAAAYYQVITSTCKSALAQPAAVECDLGGLCLGSGLVYP